MLYPELEEKVQHTRRALKGATSENIIELCKQHLALLAEYRSQLYKLRSTSSIDQRSLSGSSRQDLADTRKVVRAAIESTTYERNRTEMLLLSFTTISGYEAVEILNRRKYMGHVDWELRASGVKFRGGTGRDLLTILEAVDTAGLLRREEHVAAQMLEKCQRRWPIEKKHPDTD